MKQKQIVRMLAFVAIMLLLMPLRSMAVKIPVAILRTNADGKTKTLTFKYAERPKVFARRGQNGVHKVIQYIPAIGSIKDSYAQTWLMGFWQKNLSITTVVFDDSFAEFRPVSTYGWFHNLTKLRSIKGIENLNTSNVKSMSDMFDGCSSLTSVDVSGFNTSNVKDMGGMFFGCSSLSNIDVSGFSSSNVKDMGGMFNGCSSLSNIDVSRFNTSNVENMGGMFANCSSLTSIDVSRFNTSNVESMVGMFEGCSSLSNIDVSGFDASKVTTMYMMFKDCSSLKSINLSGFKTSEVGYMGRMFEGCSSLTSIDLSGFNTSKVREMPSMFKGCSNLSTLNICNFDISRMFNNSILFALSHNNEHLSYDEVTTYGPFIKFFNDSFKNIFQGCSSLSTLYIGHNDFDNVNELFEKGNLFNGIGTSDRPCRLVVDSDFDKSVLADHIYTTSGEDNKPIYNWLGGYFTLDNSSADARP